MYLKGIEVSGFKSFARKTEFHFQDGITGIVGPNGSGKSNVADAMRWVLGEQSAKQLRSSNMQDVIFAGTENRRAQGYAYVNIVFDNSDHRLPVDYDEVTIGRRVYRSGESEYLINSSTCRLKDVQELFYDTGIGKEGYSIIGQGQIDKILSGKPEDRRELFDEAAGIVKYKKRKNEALSRLAREEESLVRINDILSELTRQEGPLKNQAEKARAYIKYHDELRICDVNDYLAEEKESRSQLVSLEEKLKISGDQLSDLKTRADEVKRRYSELSESFVTLNRELEELRHSQEEAREASLNKKSEIAVLKEQISSQENSAGLYRQQEESARQQYQESLEEKKRLSGELARMEAEQEDKESAFTDLQSRIADISLKMEKAEQEMKACQEKEAELTRQKSGLMVDRQKYDTMSEQTQLRTAELNGKLLQARSQEADAKSELRQGKKTMKEIQEAITRCRELIQEEKKKCEEADQKLEDARKNADTARAALHQARARFDSVQNLAERYEGYGMSIRRLMESRTRFPGIHGVLADLIQVEKRYETAIETALGGALQNVVADNEQTAKQCIEYLKKNRMGRATFLPMTTVKPRGSFQEAGAFGLPGVCGTADELVHTKEQYQDIIRFLLGRILVVDTMDHALAVASRYRYSFRIVTLEGESLNAGGSISGGAYRNNSNLLGRRRELEELENAVNRAGTSCEKADTEVELWLSKKDEQTAQLNRLNSQMQEKQLEFSRVEMTLRQNLDLLDAARDEMAHLEQDVAELLKEKEHLAREYENAEKSAIDLEQAIHTAGEDARRLGQEADGYREELNRLTEQKVADQIARTSIHEKQSHLQSDLDRVLAQEAQKQQQLEELHIRQEEIRQSVLEKEILRKQYMEDASNLEKKFSELEEQIAEKTVKQEKNTEQQQELFHRQESFSSDISALEKECYRLEHQKELLEDGLERKAAYLWEEYELTPSETEIYRMEEFPPRQELKRRIQTLKSDIKALGSINTNAVEEYEELSKRLDFMRTQHEDLVHARENLQILIEQLNEGMQKQFSEKFQEIQKEFDQVFKELFGGGYGTLELAESDNMLESGILIHVQPPGKKLQNMMQLSGGEKALTAISLLFAIQNLKPSPFCILDEIEAALDDVNVDRFAAYLNKLKKNTQFIVITHRRGTMLIADQLYGITMQEKGVSSLVSVDLTDAEEQEAFKTEKG
ncbi:MAG: chromosome segregation protein SMC [Lachnospiraceae bacterium]|nr:chromosome segregation protein SMC [Lachnospiraceae bacterium]